MSVDILLSTYNGEQFLSDQLESILNQSYKDFKIIIKVECVKIEVQCCFLSQ